MKFRSIIKPIDTAIKYARIAYLIVDLLKSIKDVLSKHEKAFEKGEPVGEESKGD